MKLKTGRAIGLVVLAGIVIALATVYIIPMAHQRSENVALGRQWASLLEKHPAFSGKRPAYPVNIAFTYAAPTDENLGKLRETYDLETVAGRGPETERLINLMSWVSRLTGHANEPKIPKELNAFNLIHLAQSERMLINCYMKTVILNEVYLAMGWPSRQTHLLPHSNEEQESHVVTSVYSRSLGKWIFMDPDFGAYLTDETGVILGVSEIRNRLITGRSLVAKDVNAGGRLATALDQARDFIQGANYIWFLTDFIFKMRCPQHSRFNQAAEPIRLYFELIPDGYREALLQESKLIANGKKIVYINDEDLFWQKPAGQ